MLLYLCNGIASSPDRVKYIEYSSWQRFHSSLVEMLETDMWIYLRHRSGCEMRYQWYSDFPVASDATHHMDTPQYHIRCVTEILACPIYVQCCTSMLFLSFPCFLLVFTICSLCVLHSSLSHLRLFITVRYPFATIQDCSPHDQECLLHVHYKIKIATIRDCLLHVWHCSLLFTTHVQDCSLHVQDHLPSWLFQINFDLIVSSDWSLFTICMFDMFTSGPPCSPPIYYTFAMHSLSDSICSLYIRYMCNIMFAMYAFHNWVAIF